MYNMLYALTQAKQCIHMDTFALTLAEQGHLWMNGLLKYEVTIHKYIGSVYTGTPSCTLYTYCCYMYLI